MKLSPILVALLLFYNLPKGLTQAELNADAQIPGVSIVFRGFTNTPPVTPVTLGPATNQTIFGPRISTSPTNLITIIPPVGAAAIFQFTNASPVPTVCYVQSLEYKTEAGWKAVPVPAGNGLVGLLPPNSLRLQIIPVTMTNVNWRINVFCVEQAKGLVRTVEKGVEIGKEAITGNKTERFSGRKYLKTSIQSAK